MWSSLPPAVSIIQPLSSALRHGLRPATALHFTYRGWARTKRPPSRLVLPPAARATVSLPPVTILMVCCPALPAGAKLLRPALRRESPSALLAVAFRCLPRLGLLPPSRKRVYASTPRLRGACRLPVPSRRHVMSSEAGSWGFSAAWGRRAEYSAPFAFANILLTNSVCNDVTGRHQMV